MSKLKLTILFGFLAVLFLNAQEPLKHEKKVFVGPDKKIYINKALPVYFRISTSPDPDAPSYVLPSERTPRYSNPMYFDTEGWNSLRSPSRVDTVTKKVILPKQDILFEVYADGIAPKTNLEFIGAKKYVTKGTTYFGNDVKLEFKATDAVSGIESTYVSINQDTYKEISSLPNTFSEEKIYTIKYYSVDRVGNAELPKTQVFSIDHAPPVTTLSILGESKGKALSSKASFKLSSSDSLSGVDKIYYSLNDGPNVVYTVPIPLSAFKKDDSKISFYAVDKVGNKEEPKIITMYSGTTAGENINTSAYSYYIDREAPVISIEIIGDEYKNKVHYISDRSKIKINATDEKSGVDKILYSVNNALLKNIYTEPFILTKEGLQSVYYAAVDYVGNTVLPKSQKYIVDATAPVSKAIFSGILFNNRDTNFITGNTKISINTIETGSGIQTINYTVDSNNPQKYTQPITGQSEGFHVIKYQAIDNVNNTENMKTLNFYVDNIAPKIHHDFSVKAIGEKNIRDEKYTIYPSNAMLYVSATDNVSGGEKIEYRINGNKTALNTIPIKGLMPGNYEVEVTAWDVLRNKSTEIIKFAIEE